MAPHSGHGTTSEYSGGKSGLKSDFLSGKPHLRQEGN